MRVGYALSECEPAALEQASPRVTFQAETYRRRPKQSKTVYSTFGPLAYSRFRYEACEPGEPRLFPLDVLLGLQAHLATPALAERRRTFGRRSRAKPGVGHARPRSQYWSVSTLRKVTASLADGLACSREAAKSRKPVAGSKRRSAPRGDIAPCWLSAATASRFPCVTRLQRSQHRHARHLRPSPQTPGHALPGVHARSESSDHDLSVTAHQQGVGHLARSTGRLPTPGVSHRRRPPSAARLLPARAALAARLVEEGRPEQTLLAVGSRLLARLRLRQQNGRGFLFGEGAEPTSGSAAYARWLRDRPQGITQVLRSASQHQTHRQLSKARDIKGIPGRYRFLRKNAAGCSMPRTRRHGMPIGSGVTEAAAKPCSHNA